MNRFISLLLLILLSTTAWGQGDGVRVLRSVPTNTPLIDGVLEAEWWNAPSGNGFIQREPEEGTPSTQRTDVRVMHSERDLYISFRCYEEDPAGIESKLTKRDQLWASDRVVFWVDTYHDHRNAYQ